MHGMMSGAPKHYVECSRSNLHLHERSQRREWCQDVDRKTADNRWRRSMHPSVHAAERRPPSRDRSLLTTHMLVPFGPVCQRCESTDADSLKTIVLQQQDDALLDLVGLCRVRRVTQSSRGCASWLGVRALSSSPTPLARYRTCVQVWRRLLDTR